MYTIDVKKGTTDVTVYVKVIDSTDGTPETAVAYNTAGVDLWYMREGADHTAITEATQTAGGAHSDGGFVHISDGICRLDLPDAACVTGVDHVYVGGTFTGMLVIGVAINLVAYDPFDTVRLGLTALPNAAADAAGGLPISDAGGLDLDTVGSNVAAVLADTGTDGVVLADDAITSAKFDESTAFPLGSADTGATAVARTGADSDTLETLSDEIAAMQGNVTDILTDTDELQTDDIPTSLASIASAISTLTGYVDTEVAAILALLDDPRSEPGQGAPPVNPDAMTKIDWLYKMFRNKKTQDSSTFTLFADDGSTADQAATVSDAAGTATFGEMGTGA